MKSHPKTPGIVCPTSLLLRYIQQSFWDSRAHSRGRCISHPSGTVFQGRLLGNQEGADTERSVFGKLSATCFQHPTFLAHRHYSNGGDIEHGKSAQGGVIVCNIHRCDNPSSYEVRLTTKKNAYLIAHKHKTTRRW